LGFYSGQHLERQNEQPKADWPGRNDQGVRRLLENYRNDPESIAEKQDADDVGLEPQDSALMLFTWF
jgi:hypothetical protein